MSTIKKNVGDLLSVNRGIIVHGCNCQGVMGSGVALAIREKWPAVYEAYIDEYLESNNNLRLGSIITLADVDVLEVNPETTPYQLSLIDWHGDDLPEGIIVVNAMTQFDMAKSKKDIAVDYDAISSTFAQIKILAKAFNLPVHFPLIGCGLANGDWNEVAPRIEAALGTEVEKNLWVLE